MDKRTLGSEVHDDVSADSQDPWSDETSELLNPLDEEDAFHIELLTLQMAAAKADRDAALEFLDRVILQYRMTIPRREQLGHIYWQLGCREMAGFWWYLVPHKTRRMKDAVGRFTKAWGGNSVLMRQALRVFAESDAQCSAAFRDLDRDADALLAAHTVREKPKWSAVLIGRLIVIAILSLLVVGAITVVRWVIGWFW